MSTQNGVCSEEMDDHHAPLTVRNRLFAYQFILLLFGLCMPALVSASPAAVLLDDSRPLDLFASGYRMYYSDQHMGKLSGRRPHVAPEAPQSPGLFVSTLEPVDAFDQKKGGSYWFYTKLKNATEVSDWVFNVHNSIIESIHIYFYTSEGVNTVSAGYLFPNNYEFNYGVDFSLDKGEELEVLIFIDSSSYTSMPLYEVAPRALFKKNIGVTNFFIVASFGAIIILTLYNTFIGFSIKDRSYLYYSAYALFFAIGWYATFKGFSPWFTLDNLSIVKSPFFFSITFNTLYYIHLLGLPKQYPRLSRLSYAIVVVSFILGGTPFLFEPDTYTLLGPVMSIIWICCGLYSGLYCYSKGFKPARFFILGFIVLFVGISLLVIEQLFTNVLGRNSYVVTLLTQTLDMLLLSLALVDRINILRKQKDEVMRDAVDIRDQAMLKEHEANLKLQRALEISEQESQRKTDFLRMVSHELRTPLHSIVSSVDQWNATDDQAIRYDLLSFVSYGAARLKSQVDNLVLLAETEGKKVNPNVQDFEIRPVLDKLCSSVSGLIHEHVEFHFLLSDSGGRCPLPLGFNSDAYLIEHLLRSVLENACKYTEHGRVDFIISWDEIESALKIDINDTGCGMSDEQQADMFNAFVQVSRGLDRESEGLGLGLTICYRISEILNADFVIESELGAGTHVHISLPLQPIDAVKPVQSDKVILSGHFLVVEDNRVNAQVLERTLNSLDYKVDVVNSGQDALKVLNEKAYDIIFMDIQMPVMDGITATRWIRRRGVITPIVAITANSDSQVRKRCIEVGMNDLIVKPARRADIQRVIERQIPTTQSV